MSAIAEILSLVNGNPNKTLDELFLEHLGLGATDAPLKDLLVSSETLAGKYDTVGETFSPTVNGTLRLIATFLRGLGSVSSNIYIRILEDNSTIKESYFSGELLQEGEPFVFSVDFNIKSGKEYQVEMYCDTFYKPDCQSLKVCGSVSDPSLII